MVGGGSGSNIGATHRYAAHFDDRYTLVTGTFATDSERSCAFAAELGITPERQYGSWQELLATEEGRDDSIDVVTIVTPNNSHYEIAKAFLEAGIDVICDKPLTTDLDQTLDLLRIQRERGLVFGVTYSPLWSMACSAFDLSMPRLPRISKIKDIHPIILTRKLL